MEKTIEKLGGALKFLLYQWLVVVLKLVRRCCRARKRQQQEKRDVPRRIRRASKNKCVPLRHRAYHRPDPMIYSQYYLMKKGLAVTWDNPDIQLYLNGVAVSSAVLQPATQYEIRARCWNASYDAPVVGMPVRFSYLSFGAGSASNFIGVTSVSLGVIGGSDNPNYASVPWKTPAAAGHYCIQVKLEWNDDINPENNLGQENTNVIEATSPAIFDFQVRNSEVEGHRYHLETDAYTLPPMLDCAEMRNLGARKAEVIRARNNRDHHPVPPGWVVQAAPALFGLAPGEEKMVQVTVTPPDDFAGDQPINFNVFDERQVLVGGVTVIVRKN
jgi:hypothetical protein